MGQHLDAARATRRPIVRLGGAFMTSPQIAAEEAQLGLPGHYLYFRGRSAVLGDAPGPVVAALFGNFPAGLVDAVIGKASRMVGRQEAIDAYIRACSAWGATALATEGLSTDEVADAADLLLRVVDDADVSGLALVAGWRSQPRPEAPPARLAYALMLARELRGGLHYAALRACGLGVSEAVVADPEAGRRRLLATGWRPEDADALVARAQSRPDLHERWQRAEQLTDEATAEALRALDQQELERLVSSLGVLRTSS